MNYEGLFDQILHDAANRSYEVEFLEEHEPQVEYRGPEEGMLPLFDEEYQNILIQRDVHFGQKFDIMLEYYKKEDAPGIDENINIHKIEEVSALEKRLGKNIAPYLLGVHDMEKIAYFRNLYRQFKEVYEQAAANSTEKLLASLFLSDGNWEELVQKVDVSCIDKPQLLFQVLDDERFSDILSPGFGTVPKAVARLLGKIATKEAMYVLFSAVGTSSFELEEEVLAALKAIGTPVRDFCIQKVESDVLSLDHEKALIVLQEFVPDEKVCECARSFLKRDTSKDPILREYAASLLLI